MAPEKPANSGTEAVKPKRGRKSSGLPPDVVQRLSTDNRRKRILNSGKVRFDDFVLPETKEGLRQIKDLLFEKMPHVKTLGIALDEIIKSEIKRRKLTVIIPEPDQK